MTTPDLEKKKALQELESKTQQQIALTSGVFQDDVMMRTLLESLAEGVVIIGNSGTILLVNTRAEQMYGYPKDEIIGKHFSSVYPEEERNAGKPEEELKKAAAEGRLEAGGWRLRKDGKRFWSDVIITALHDESGNLRGFSKVTHDSTERKRAEEAERILRNIVELSTNLFYMHTTDNYITYVSPQSRQFFDCEPEEVLVRWTEFITDNPVNRGAIEATQRAINTGQRQPPYLVECIGRTGRKIWAEINETPVVENGKTVAIVGSLTDITERKRAEDALLESEKKFSKAFQATPSVLVIASLADGRYIEVNDAFERLLGYRHDEVIGVSALDLNIWQNQEDRAIVLRMLAEGKKVRDLEIGFRSKSGTILVGLYSAEIIEIGAEQCLVSVVSDITARKKAEEALRQSEDRYRRLYKDTPVMLHSIDPDGRLVSVSNCWLETLGYERSEVLGRISTDLYTAASRSYATEVVLPEFFRTGSCKEVPYQIVKKNGEILDILLSAIAERDSEGKVVRSLAVMVDITERKRAAEALLKSENKFSRIFHAAPVMISISTLAEGRFIDVNEACLRILGYPREELIGRTSLEVGMWGCQEDRDLAIRALEGQGTVRDLEVNLRSKTGETVAVLFTMELLDIGDERYLLSLARDITERKRAEEEIKRLNTDLAARADDLEYANRELEAFNYTVAHDLRQPLNVIGLNCQAIDMLCGDQLQEECKGYVQEVYSGALRMNQLIDALLNFSRMGHVEPCREVVDMSAVAHEVGALLKLAEPERQVDFRIDDGIVANGDANLLRVVLDNLIGNAWKYTGMREKAVIEFGVTDIGGVPTYFVQDNGEGFDKANADKLFVPFRRLPGAVKCGGFGIGLATVERIIRHHGGRVWAEGEPDKGATFWFTI